jgi:hypothetical protein
MLKKIKMFMNYLDLAISKSFFGSQSISRYVLRDRFNALIRPDIKAKHFSICRGQLSRVEIPNFDESKSRSRGNSTAVLSSMYFDNELPAAFQTIINAHLGEIESYLGKNFIYTSTLYFRTHHMPESLETFDVYSNVWHLDSHEGDRLLKIFVCLSDVGPSDGPFIFLDRDSTIKHWGQLVERWDFKKFEAIPSFPEEQVLIAPRGSYLMINTSTCMHRASNPSKHRDMMQVELYPNWCKAQNRTTFKTGA